MFNDRKEQKGRNDGVDLDLDLGSAAAQIALDTTTRLGYKGLINSGPVIRSPAGFSIDAWLKWGGSDISRNNEHLRM